MICTQAMKRGSLWVQVTWFVSGMVCQSLGVIDVLRLVCLGNFGHGFLVVFGTVLLSGIKLSFVSKKNRHMVHFCHQNYSQLT
jgi:hypothetical protein